MRLFIGIPVSGDYVRIMRRLQDAWRPRLASRVSWTRPELAHVTLKFLGEVDEGRVPAIGDAMRTAVGEVFRLQGGGGCLVPSGKRPRVLWVNMENGRKECLALFSRLERALAEAGFAPEARPFIPHLTLARIAFAASGDPWPDLLRDLGGVWPECVAERIVLWRSTLGSSGPRYDEVRTVALTPCP